MATLAMLISFCGSANEVTVELTPTIATGASSGLDTTVELYPLTTWVDAAGLTQSDWPDQPALTAVTGLDRTVMFDWDSERPFRIATKWQPAGPSCWIAASEVFVSGGEFVEVPLHMICE